MLPIWQNVPLNPGAQMQDGRPYHPAKHDPPFWHGLNKHVLVLIPLVHKSQSRILRGKGNLQFCMNITCLTVFARETRRTTTHVAHESGGTGTPVKTRIRITTI